MEAGSLKSLRVFTLASFRDVNDLDAARAYDQAKICLPDLFADTAPTQFSNSAPPLGNYLASALPGNIARRLGLNSASTDDAAMDALRTAADMLRPDQLRLVKEFILTRIMWANGLCDADAARTMAAQLFPKLFT